MTITTRENSGAGVQPLFLPGVIEQRPSPLSESGMGLELPTGYRREVPGYLDIAAQLALAEGASDDRTLEEQDELEKEQAREPFQLIGAESLAQEPLDEAEPAKPLGRARKPFNLIDPNQTWVMWVGVLLLGSVLAAALVASFNSVYDMAEWIGMPQSIQWLPVVILDVAIVGFSWALMVFSTRAADQSMKAVARGQVREATKRTRFYLIVVTLMSVVANFMHTYDYWMTEQDGIGSPQSIVGLIYSASIPLWALAATEELIRMVFARRKKVYDEAAAAEATA